MGLRKSCSSGLDEAAVRILVHHIHPRVNQEEIGDLLELKAMPIARQGEIGLDTERETPFCWLKNSCNEWCQEWTPRVFVLAVMGAYAFVLPLWLRNNPDLTSFWVEHGKTCAQVLSALNCALLAIAGFKLYTRAEAFAQRYSREAQIAAPLRCAALGLGLFALQYGLKCLDPFRDDPLMSIVGHDCFDAVENPILALSFTSAFGQLHVERGRQTKGRTVGGTSGPATRPVWAFRRILDGSAIAWLHQRRWLRHAFILAALGQLLIDGISRRIPGLSGTVWLYDGAISFVTMSVIAVALASWLSSLETSQRHLGALILGGSVAWSICQATPLVWEVDRSAPLYWVNVGIATWAKGLGIVLAVLWMTDGSRRRHPSWRPA